MNFTYVFIISTTTEKKDKLKKINIEEKESEIDFSSIQTFCTFAKRN